MSIGHRLEEDELSDTTTAELYSMLGMMDTPRLFGEGFEVITDKDVPFGGGNSTDRRRLYIDRILYQMVMDNEFEETGIDPRYILGAWIQHEHTEKCIVDGNNPVDRYIPAHHRALRREHEFVKFLGCTPVKYEEVIWPALVRCYHRPIKNPPQDLWCGPLLDDPTDRDEEILDALRSYKVLDAFKRNKIDTHYGFANHECQRCTHFGQVQRELAPCTVVNGLVRIDRGCDLWKEKANA